MQNVTLPTTGRAPDRRLPEPQPCGGIRCDHCRFRSEETGAIRIRPLTIDDLRWFYESESALGARSTHGAFVAMAESGIMTGGFGNGVETRAVEHRRLRDTGRHNCILRRIRAARLPAHHAVALEVALGPADWTRNLETIDREAVRAALAPELWQLAPLTSKAVAHAERHVVAPTPPRHPKKAPKSQPSSQHSEEQKETVRARRAFLASARGAVVLMCRDGDRKVLGALEAEARGMLRAAIDAVGARARKQRMGVRGSTKPEGARVKARPIEPRSDAEALCG